MLMEEKKKKGKSPPVVVNGRGLAWMVGALARQTAHVRKRGRRKNTFRAHAWFARTPVLNNRTPVLNIENGCSVIENGCSSKPRMGAESVLSAPAFTDMGGLTSERADHPRQTAPIHNYGGGFALLLFFLHKHAYGGKIPPPRKTCLRRERLPTHVRPATTVATRVLPGAGTDQHMIIYIYMYMYIYIYI